MLLHGPSRTLRSGDANRPIAEKLAASLDGDGFKSVSIVEDLEGEVRAADVISCATLSTEPLVWGKWLSPGQHVDLVGAFKARYA